MDQLMMVYRKRAKTWHWRADCSQWPTGTGFKEKYSKPRGDLCNQCRAKDRRDKREVILKRKREAAA